MKLADVVQATRLDPADVSSAVYVLLLHTYVCTYIRMGQRPGQWKTTRS